jgi:metal-dependent amidase/aminoacylase/carboxypeptidase family protein
MHYVYKMEAKFNVIPEEASVWLWIRDSKEV